jgi:hypothetical protein
MTRAMMSVNPRLLKLLGQKLYSSHPLPIVVRELLQNSRDACQRKGVVPAIEIKIEVKTNYETWVTCVDNGIGMTESEIIDNFLCLGNTSKNDSSSVGGFGIAKAALMRNEWWSVNTLDNYIDSTFFDEEKDIAKTPGILEGTMVQVKITDSLWESTFKKAIAMVDLSDVSVVLNAQYLQNTPISRYAGLEIELTPYVVPNVSWKAYASLPFNEYHSLNVYRVHGLVQCMGEEYGGRKTNIFIDFEPTCRPESAEYPFNMSRESITSETALAVEEFMAEKQVNGVSQEYEIEDDQKGEKVPRLITGTATMSGTRTRPYGMGEREYMKYMVEQREGHYQPSEDIEKRETGSIMLYMDGYTQNDNQEYDIKMLAVWRDLLTITAHKDEDFGIGMTTDMRVYGRRKTVEGNLFYLFCPEQFRNMSGTATIVRLYHTAVHESAHYMKAYHNEHFTMEESAIYSETVEEVSARIPYLLSLLR